MASSFDPEAILRSLVSHEVDFIVIGALAAYLHGSPLPTLDIDITPNPKLANMARLSKALSDMNAKVRAEGVEPLTFSHDARSLAAGNIWNLTTTYGELDIAAVPAGTRGYADLRQGATPTKIGPIEVLVASLSDVIRSKEAAGRDKDRRALPVLRELLAKQRG